MRQVVAIPLLLCLLVISCGNDGRRKCEKIMEAFEEGQDLGCSGSPDCCFCDCELVPGMTMEVGSTYADCNCVPQYEENLDDEQCERILSMFEWCVDDIPRCIEEGRSYAELTCEDTPAE